jgi:hypothetical protein
VNEYLILPIIAIGAVVILVVLLQNAFVHASRRREAVAAPPSDSLSQYAIIFFMVSGLFGLFLRLYGFNRSLWLDEFGTLWAVEGTMGQLLERVQAFHGQSPFYYSLVWLLVNLLGESEIVLRGLSLILGVGTTYGSYMLGNFLFGKKTALMAATFYWLSPAAVQLESQARPYALALLMAVVMFYGFARAAQDGDRLGRWLFVCGGVGLFLAQYALILAACGVAVAYFFLGRVRAQYGFSQFAFDVVIQIAIASSCFLHVMSLWNRRDSLTWLGPPNYLALFELIGPFFIIAIIPLMVRFRGQVSAFQNAMVRVLWVTFVVQASLLYLLAYAGTNLLHPRYMIVLIIPIVILAAAALPKLPAHLNIAPMLYWLSFIGALFLINFTSYGAFSRAGFQDWKTAVSCLDQFVRRDPEAIVLYRSGFVEEDEFRREKISTAVVAPVKTLTLQEARLIGLTYSWDKSWREDYFTRVVEPAIDRAHVFYFLTCAGCFNQATGQYPENLTAWVELKFPGKFQRTVLQVGRGITLLRFVREKSLSSPNKPALVGLVDRNGAGQLLLSSARECKMA